MFNSSVLVAIKSPFSHPLSSFPCTNLGGAFTQIFMGSILFPLFTRVFDGDSEKSWRLICVFPAAIAFTWGCIVPFISDDAPMGKYSEMRKNGSMDQIFFTTSLRSGATKNTWILYVQYACSFGVELVMVRVCYVVLGSFNHSHPYTVTCLLLIEQCCRLVLYE